MRTAIVSSVSCVAERFSHLLQEVRNLSARFRLKEPGYDVLEGQKGKVTIWRILRIRNRPDPVIAKYRMARFYFGLNLIYQEMIEPLRMIRIPLPFAEHDHSFLRYKKVIPNKHFSIVEERLEDRMKLLKMTIINGGDDFGLLTSVLRILEEMRYGWAVTKELS